ncbi:MAG: PilZ domain-containing protein [Pseudomonadota bacterium]
MSDTPATPTGEERRSFTRIPIDNRSKLNCNGRQWDTRLLDISLKGALIERPSDYDGQAGDACTLEVILEPQDKVITMQGVTVHSEAAYLGFRCDYIDLESVSHLKRLVELNLGDSARLERELSELVSD